MNSKRTITIAVLPFENLSEGNPMEIFCRSFCVDLITELSFFRQFQIVAYQSVKDLHRNPELLNKKLVDMDVNYVVHGSFRSISGKLLINAQLLESTTNRLVWGNRLEGQFSALIHIQENLLKEIVSSLQQQLNYDLIKQIRQKNTVTLKAYEYWLNGIEELKNGTEASDLRAREHFQEALAIEPEYSLAYSGMSLSYFNEWSCQLWDRWAVSQNGAYEWAQKAIALDEQNYIAAFILGRVFLYEAAYESAEYYLRKSLQLNSNDPESLIQISSCMTFLGYGTEALALYEKTLKLNPIHADSYNQIGAFIHFELGNFEIADTLATKTRTRRWVDADAYYAATYFHLGDVEKMKVHWERFLAAYKQRINPASTTTEEAVSWMMKVNPYRHHTNLHPFWDYISQNNSPVAQSPNAPVPKDAPATNIFEKQSPSDVWTYCFDGKQGFLPEVKGFHDLYRLIMNTGQPFHCTELMETNLVESGVALIDTEAKRQYQRKIKDLQMEILEAEEFSDYAKSARLQHEYETLTSHLSRSLGIEGNPREHGGTVEKARSAITWRIRSAISRIEKVHASLGKHLSHSVKTGTFCTYSPEHPVAWNT